MNFLELVSPLIISTSALNSFSRSFIKALLAFPFSGGACSRTFKVPSSSWLNISDRGAHGVTLMFRLIWPLCWSLCLRISKKFSVMALNIMRLSSRFWSETEKTGIQELLKLDSCLHRNDNEELKTTELHRLILDQWVEKNFFPESLQVMV